MTRMSKTMITPTIMWKGASKRRHLCWVYPIDDFSPLNEGGVYIFAVETSPGLFKPVYIGQTENLNQHMKSLKRKGCARGNGATHIHVKYNKDMKLRIYDESDLVKMWEPICNDRRV
jgi:hypothetical protein